jgi:hypothetical protein
MAESAKAPSQPSAPHKNPRSAHIREANGGYIASMHGGDEDPSMMGQDHVAPDMGSLMAKLHAHMGGAEESTGDMLMESPQDEMTETGMPAPEAPPKKAPPKKGHKKPKIKVRDKSETY